MKQQKPLTSNKTIGLKYGFRSGLEEAIGADLIARKVGFTFEKLVLSYLSPAKKRKYTPDWVLENGIIIESKGRFVTADRQKHLLVKAAHPKLDIRFVFNNASSKIAKKSKTTYGMWCEKHGFKYYCLNEAWHNLWKRKQRQTHGVTLTFVKRECSIPLVPQSWIDE